MDEATIITDSLMAPGKGRLVDGRGQEYESVSLSKFRSQRVVVAEVRVTM